MSQIDFSLAQQTSPLVVQTVLGFFERHQLWCIISRNSRATSCRDAAARRYRLGKTGIPLYDELKSFAAVAYFPDGQRRYVLLHCRANTQLDLEKTERFLGVNRPLARLSEHELADLFYMEYGSVNPFVNTRDFVQIFDKGVLANLTPPETMMTNAGEHTWAVEFRPTEVIQALTEEGVQVMVDDIVKDATAINASHLPVFGIITGNGPESGIALWRQMNQEIYDELTAKSQMQGDLSYPKVLLHSLPEMGLSMELPAREKEVWAVIQASVQKLCADGVTHIALACNTTQYFTQRIRAALPPGVTFVSMAETAIAYIEKQQLSDITIIGIPIVADLGSYSAYRSLMRLDVKPVSDQAKEHLLEFGYMVKRLDHAGQDNVILNKINHIIRSGVLTDNVLIALTEISVFLARYPKIAKSKKIGNKNIIDTLQLYAEKLANIYIQSLPFFLASEEDRW